MSKVYAVRVGRQTGLFNTWSECEAQIKHFPCAEYKSFITKEEAEAYLNRTQVQPDETSEDAIIVYVDGSYNPSDETCGYASFLMHGNKKKIICGRFKMTDGGRNVEGEVRAAYETLKYLKIKQYKEIVIYYDYEGIANWADKVWSAKKFYNSNYAAFVDKLRGQGYHISFRHVYGHTDIQGNEYVDRIAKLACGVEVPKKDSDLIEEINDINGFPTTLPQLNPPDWCDYKKLFITS